MTRRPALKDLTCLALPSDPAISPDGQTVVYVLATVDAEADRNRQALWLVGTAQRQPRPLTLGATDTAPRWSPDGTRLAFLRGGDGPAQIWLLRMDGPGEPEQLTTMPLGAGAPVWAPDGTRLACIAPADRAATEDETNDEAGERRRHAPVVVDRLRYKADGHGLLGTLRQQLFVVDVATGQAQQITDGDQQVVAVAWHPDGKRLAIASTATEAADLTEKLPICLVDGDDGLVLRSTVTGPMAEVTPQPVQEYPMVPVEPGLFVIRPEGTQAYTPVTFYTLEDGTPYVHYGVRANPKVS